METHHPSQQTIEITKTESAIHRAVMNEQPYFSRRVETKDHGDLLLLYGTKKLARRVRSGDRVVILGIEVAEPGLGAAVVRTW